MLTAGASRDRDWQGPRGCGFDLWCWEVSGFKPGSDVTTPAFGRDTRCPMDGEPAGGRWGEDTGSGVAQEVMETGFGGGRLKAESGWADGVTRTEPGPRSGAAAPRKRGEGQIGVSRVMHRTRELRVLCLQSRLHRAMVVSGGQERWGRRQTDRRRPSQEVTAPATEGGGLRQVLSRFRFGETSTGLLNHVRVWSQGTPPNSCLYLQNHPSGGGKVRRELRRAESSLRYSVSRGSGFFGRVAERVTKPAPAPHQGHRQRRERTRGHRALGPCLVTATADGSRLVSPSSSVPDFTLATERVHGVHRLSGPRPRNETSPLLEEEGMRAQGTRHAGRLGRLGSVARQGAGQPGSEPVPRAQFSARAVTKGSRWRKRNACHVYRPAETKDERLGPHRA